MRLLIIEDEPDLRDGLSTALRREGYAIDTAADGVEGLHKAVENEYDLVVLDVMLPQLDGWALLQRLRTRRKTPVLMLTARDTVDDRIRGLDTGADDYLAKPFDIGELQARVRALIRRSAGQSTSTLSLANGVVIDGRTRAVRRAGQPVALTAREFCILEYLALRRGTVVSRTELYEHLFDENDDTLSNLIEVHVSNLRRKLGHEVIETRRGLGYSVPA